MKYQSNFLLQSYFFVGGGLPVEIVQNRRKKGNLEKGWKDLILAKKD